MLRRLLLTLLTLCLAAPALAMPLAHPPVSQAHAMHGHSGHHQEGAAVKVKHDCIGCIAPLAALPHPPKPLAAPRIVRKQAKEAALARVALPPETPPPRG